MQSYTHMNVFGNTRKTNPWCSGSIGTQAFLLGILGIPQERPRTHIQPSDFGHTLVVEIRHVEFVAGSGVEMSMRGYNAIGAINRSEIARCVYRTSGKPSARSSVSCDYTIPDTRSLVMCIGAYFPRTNTQKQHTYWFNIPIQDTKIFGEFAIIIVSKNF